MRKPYLICMLLLTAIFCNAQQVVQIASKAKVSLRGLSAPTNNVVWVSGSSGTVAKSVDGGTTWVWMTVPGYEKTDFRDIEAFDKNTAIIMGIDTPAVILRTTDGGKSWALMYKNATPGMFLDAMAFWNINSGIVIGDPIDGHLFVARTFDGGKKWQRVPPQNCPATITGEACFASSGTNVQKLTKDEAIIITGGLQSSVFIKNTTFKLPMLQGQESTGANSIGVKNKNTFVIVGGDFTKKDSVTGNCTLSRNGGKTFTTPATPPLGYRSCVIYTGKKNWITCGLNGVDISTDDAENFKGISKDSYNVVQKAKKGKAVYFAGSGGRIGKLIAAK